MVSVALVGELDLAAAPIAEAELREACANADLLVLDLAAVTFMDCAGLRVLLAADERLRASGGRLAIVHAPLQVRRLFDLTGTRDQLQLGWDAAAPDPGLGAATTVREAPRRPDQPAPLRGPAASSPLSPGGPLAPS